MRVKETKLEAYKFTNMPALMWHSGKWWHMGVEVREYYNNGSMAMVIGGVKYGKKKFIAARKKDAIKFTLIIDESPF
jgi:hypothetical protein